jgi:4-aminobutyrate aminotransferase-like enzyme
MAPPLTVTDDEIELATEILDSSLVALHISAQR